MKGKANLHSTGQSSKGKKYVNTFTPIDPIRIPVLDKQELKTTPGVRLFNTKGTGNIEHTCIGRKLPSTQAPDIPLLKPVAIISRTDKGIVETVGFCYHIDPQTCNTILFREGWSKNNYMISLSEIVGVYDLIGVVQD